MYNRHISAAKKGSKFRYTIHRGELPTSQEIRAKGIYIASFDPAILNLAFQVEFRGPGMVKTFLAYKLCLDSEVRDGKSGLYLQISGVLNSMAYINDLRMVVVERQIPMNYEAVRVSQHIISYFMDKGPSNLCIVELDSQVKTKYLNAPKGLKGKAVKIWSGQEARKLLALRQDLQMLQLLEDNKKKDDDLADTTIQIEALSNLLQLPTTSELLQLALPV